MLEQQERTYTPYTYTYDQFTVFFHGGRVYIGEKDYPVGQCCVDILNMDEGILDEIDLRVKEFVPTALDLLRKKTNSAAASAQEKLQRCLGYDLFFAGLPGFKYGLRLQLPCTGKPVFR